MGAVDAVPGGASRTTMSEGRSIRLRLAHLHARYTSVRALSTCRRADGVRTTNHSRILQMLPLFDDTVEVRGQRSARHEGRRGHAPLKVEAFPAAQRVIVTEPVPAASRSITDDGGQHWVVLAPPRAPTTSPRGRGSCGAAMLMMLAKARGTIPTWRVLHARHGGCCPGAR